MPVPADHAAFGTANPHALATILEASQTRSIIASQDIFDTAGIKLWARDQPVSSALQRKLLDRQLRNPLESCLMAEDGVTAQGLVQGIQQMLAQPGWLQTLVQGDADRIVAETAQLPIHPVAQLLLTAGQTSRPESFKHALQSMAVAGTLMIGHGGSVAAVRLAMLGGLLHDLGEMYIDPRHGEADADRTLDFQSYQQLVVHPHVGKLLLTQLTNYPATLARGISEHHERLDGSGYPHGLKNEAVSPLGRLLAVTEATMAVLCGDQPHRACLARASVALRAVPGEFDLTWAGRIGDAVRAQPALPGSLDQAEVQARLQRLDAALTSAQETATALAGATEEPALREAVGLSLHLLARLRAGWNCSGLWSPQAVSAQDAAEVEAVEDELLFRLRSIERAARLRAGELPSEGAAQLESLCAALSAAPR